MQESHSFQKALAYGVSVILLGRAVQPQVTHLHDTVVNIDRMANLMLKRGELVASKLNHNFSHSSRSLSNSNRQTPDDNCNYRQ